MRSEFVYDYDAFGKETRSSTLVAGLNPDSFPFHYSTKFTDPESGFNYYGYRFYDPSNGRWLNRDPIEEEGGVNLYNFVENNPINWVDFLGLVDLSYTPPAETDLTDWEKGFNTDDKFDVAGHGNSQSMFDKNKKPITPNKVADDIIKDPKYKPGDTVGLISCSTGAGNNSFAQKLADALAKKTGKPTTVRAPTKTTYPGPPGGRPTVPGGVYKDFKGKP
jgi:RHS repeat-associated protein